MGKPREKKGKDSTINTSSTKFIITTRSQAAPKEAPQPTKPTPVVNTPAPATTTTTTSTPPEPQQSEALTAPTIPETPTNSTATKEDHLVDPISKKGAKKYKDCAYREYSVEFDEADRRIIFACYEFFIKGTLFAKKKTIKPVSLILEEGSKALVHGKVEEFEVLAIRVTLNGTKPIHLMLLDPANPKGDVTPVELRMITLLTPCPTYDKKRSERYVQELVDAHNKKIKAEAAKKVKRARTQEIPAPKRPAPSNKASEVDLTAISDVVSGIVQKGISDLRSEVDTTLTKMRKKQKKDYRKLLEGNQAYALGLLHACTPKPTNPM